MVAVPGGSNQKQTWVTTGPPDDNRPIKTANTFNPVINVGSKVKNLRNILVFEGMYISFWIFN